MIQDLGSYQDIFSTWSPNKSFKSVQNIWQSSSVFVKIIVQTNVNNNLKRDEETYQLPCKRKISKKKQNESVYLFIYLFIFLFIYLFIYSFIYLFIYLFIYQMLAEVLVTSLPIFEVWFKLHNGMGLLKRKPAFSIPLFKYRISGRLCSK